MKSHLSQAKGLGSAKSGLHHWLHQRFTALCMLVITIPLLILLWDLNSVNLAENIIYILRTPFYILSYSIFAVIAMYHGMLGMKVIVEDYIHCRALRLCMILSLQFITLITIVAFIIALIYIIR